MPELILKNLHRKLRIGDVILIHESGLRHWFTRWLTATFWHHVLLYIGNSQVLENTPRKGCHITDVDKLRLSKKSFVVLRHKDIKEEDAKRIVKFAREHFLNRRFSFEHLILIGLWLLTGKKLNHRESSAHIICSNIVSLAYAYFGYDIARDISPTAILPKDFENSEDFRTVFDYEKKQNA